MFKRKEYYKEYYKLFKPLYDAMKKKKKRDKKKGIYDLVTIIDRGTLQEYQIHVGINFSDKMRRKGVNILKKKILYGKQNEIIGVKKIRRYSKISEWVLTD